MGVQGPSEEVQGGAAKSVLKWFTAFFTAHDEPSSRGFSGRLWTVPDLFQVP